MKSKSLIPLIPLNILAGIILPSAAHAQWDVKTYNDGGAAPFQILNLAQADQVIGGSNQEYSFASTYTTSNTQDNGDGGGPFGLGVQIAGLPPGDNQHFTFQALGSFAVAATGSYTFFNNTDDGSRLRLSINGGVFSDIIIDDVLSGPHTVSSGAQALTLGDTIQLEWTWFEAGGGAEGETWYSNDGGTSNALWEDGILGLTLSGGSYTGTVYKAEEGQGGNPGTNPNGPNNLAEADAYVSLGAQVGAGSYDVINFGGGGRVGGESALPAGTPGDHFVVDGTGFIVVDPGEEGDWTFFTNTDDGARLRIGGADVVVDDALQAPSDSAYMVYNFPSAGTYSVQYTGFENGGGESFEVWVKQGNFAAPKGAGDGTGALLLGDDAGLDVSPVPEPGTASLVSVALLALAGKRRRRA